MANSFWTHNYDVDVLEVRRGLNVHRLRMDRMKHFMTKEYDCWTMLWTISYRGVKGGSYSDKAQAIEDCARAYVADLDRRILRRQTGMLAKNAPF